MNYFIAGAIGEETRVLLTLFIMLGFIAFIAWQVSLMPAR